MGGWLARGRADAARGGGLRYVPHERGFADLDPAHRGLVSIPVALRRTGTIVAVEPYHVSLFDIAPIDAGRARIRVTVLVDPEQARGRPEKVAEDVALLKAGLAEDYAIGESIQAGFAAGANEHLHFGLFEGTLAHFHRTLAGALGG